MTLRRSHGNHMAHRVLLILNITSYSRAMVRSMLGQRGGDSRGRRGQLTVYEPKRQHIEGALHWPVQR